MESNGQGAWIRYTPSESWHAYVEAEDKLVFYTGAAWQGLPNTDDPELSVLGCAVFQDQRSNGTDGGTAGAGGVFLPRTLQTTIVNTISGASLATNQITLPAGTFAVQANAAFYRTGETQIRFKSTTTSTVIHGEQTRIDTGATGDALHLSGVLVLSASETFQLEYYVESNPGTAALGRSMTSNNIETFATVTIINLAALQGPAGDQGEQGPQGFAGFKYQYSSVLAAAATDPGAGALRLDSLILPDVLLATIDVATLETGSPNIGSEIASWNESGILKIAKVGVEQNFVTFNVVAAIPQGGTPTHYSLTLAYRDHAGSFTGGDPVSVQFIPRGPTGASGSAFPVFDYEFNTAIAGDPGGGKLLFDNTVLASATSFSIHDLDRLSPAVDRSTEISTWDDANASTLRGYLYLINAATAARVATFKVTGPVGDNGAYQTMPVIYVAGVAPANNTRVAVMFVPAGATGAIGGTTGLVDNRILRADGPGGTTLQNSLITVDDLGHVSGVGKFHTHRI